ncbi:MAG TPA: hypothetical protein VN285_13145 [Candidatus Deferrimicrobium sp.]|nr:hypothetical protein [Candidatus Deferrimicrobium sp.]
MGEIKQGTDFGATITPIIRKFIENIENPFVWVPLGLFGLCVLAFKAAKFEAFLYVALAFLLVAFIAECAWRIKNRRTPRRPVPGEAAYAGNLKQFLIEVQAKAVALLQQGKVSAARALSEKNLEQIEQALAAFPDDADFQSLMGYTLKDLYQSSKGVVTHRERKRYLASARKFFDRAIEIEPHDASAHNGMGNVLFFEGRFDEAIEEHAAALRLSGGQYEAAKHDRLLVERVKKGEIPFDNF